MLIVSKQKSSKSFRKIIISAIGILLFFLTLIEYYRMPIASLLREQVIVRSIIKSYGIGGIDRDVNVVQLFYNLFSNFSNLFFLKNIETIRLKPFVLDLKFKQFKKLEESRIRALGEGFIYHGHPKVKGYIKFPEGKAKVKLQIKGYQLDHLATNKWSFKIEIKNSSFAGMQKFSLQAPFTKDFQSAPVIQEAMRTKGILAPRDGFVDLTINGKKIGLMYFIEDLNEQFTEASNLPYGPIFRYDEKAETISFENKKKFWLNDPTQQFIGEKIENIILNPKKYMHLIDLNKWAEYLSITFLLKCFHGNVDFNLSYYFHPLNRKLEPISTDHSCGQKADDRPLRFLPIEGEFIYKLIKNKKFQLILEQKLIWWMNHPLAQTLIQDLNKKSSNFKSLVAKEAPFIGKFQIQNSHLDEVLQWLKKINNQPVINIYTKNEITPPLQTKFIPNLIIKRNSNLFLATLHPFQKEMIQLNELFLKRAQAKTIYKISNETDSNKITTILNNNLKLKYLDNTPKVLLNYSHIGKKKDNLTINSQFAYIENDINLFKYTKPSIIANYFKYKTDDKTFYIEENSTVYINQLINFPYGENVKLGTGSTLIFSENAGLIINGSLFVDGKNDNFVTLKGNETTNWSGIQINSFKSLSIINNLIMDGGNGSFEGLLNRGAFTINNGSVEIQNSLFQNNKSEDALNLSQVIGSLDNIRIQNTQSDALDIDFSKVKISNSRFINIGLSTGADAIDISKSQLTANNIEIVNVTDKGVSIGESSKANFKNITISNASVGLVAKDSSHLIAKNVILRNIDMADTMVYKKKEHFSGAILEIQSIKEYSRRHIAEHGSKLILNGSIIKTQKVDVKNLYATKMKSVK